MGASESQSASIAAKAGCGGCLVPVALTALAFGLAGTVYYFGDVHEVQMLHAGDETRFDPIAALPYATSLAQASDFFQMTARFVRSDGTLDLTESYDPEVTYQWLGPITVGSSKPVGAPGGASSRLMVSVRASEFGFEHTGSAPDGAQYYDLNLGMRRREVSVPITGLTATPPPKCKLAAIWKYAIAAGAPADAVAVIRYSSRGYDFRIEGTEFHETFGMNCKLIN